MKKLWLWSFKNFGSGMKRFMNQSSAINISLLCFMNQRAEQVIVLSLKKLYYQAKFTTTKADIFNSRKMLLMISLLLHNTSPLR